MIKKFKLKKLNNINIYKKKKFKTRFLIKYITGDFNNLKKVFLYLNVLNKKEIKKYILIVGDSVLYKLFDYIFMLKNKKKIMYKFKNIIFYNQRWIPGTMSSKIKFFKFLKTKIRLIIIFESERVYINNLYKELLKFKLPIIFFFKGDTHFIKKLGTYRISYNGFNNKFHLMFLIGLLRITIKNETI